MENEFLNEEIRCDFTVSEKRKKIWKVQIDLIKELHRICEKYNLKYFASNGTLLGVIRHNGFVPWDDDVDIVMPRKDYDKLMEVAKEECEYPFFLQTAANEEEYFRNYARLRNCETTAMPFRDWNKKSCNGIFIDIFPLDGYSENKFKNSIQQFRFKLNCALANTYIYYPDFEDNGLVRKVLYTISKVYCKMFKYTSLLNKIEKIRTKVSYEKASTIYEVTHGGKFMVFPKKFYENATYMDFEYIKLPVPAEYDQILKKHYGDYMQLPPKEERGQHHTILFDPEKSYTEYIGKMTKEEAKNLINNY